MRLLVDTNVLIYDTVEDSEYHDRAKEIIDEADEIAIPSIVVYEYIWAMYKLARVAPEFISLKIEEYFEDPRIVFLPEQLRLIHSALRMLKEDNAGLREINDYIILATALHYNLALATFDKKLIKRALKRGVKVLS